MDFNEFRKKKMEEKKAQAEDEVRAAQPAANGRDLDWIEGMGPAGPRNPKIKGFVLGRFQRKRVDPSTIEKPKGYEATHAEGVAHEATKAELEIERRRKALEKAQADLEAAQEATRLAEIDERRKREGISQIKGRQRY